MRLTYLVLIVIIIRSNKLLKETIMERHFLELVLSVSEDSVTCISCYAVLEHHLSFINNCWYIEQKIREHYEGKGSNRSSLALISLHTAVTKEYHNQAGDTNTKTEMKDECCLEIKEQKLDNGQLTKGQDSCGRYQDVKSFLVKKTPPDDIDIKFTEDAFAGTPYKYEQYDFHNCILSQGNNSKAPLHSCNTNECQVQWKGESPMHILHHESNSGVLISTKFHHKPKHKFEELLLTHRMRSDNSLYRCEVCAFQTKCKVSLQGHMLTHKGGQEVSLYMCKICTHLTKFKSSLVRHMLIHKGTSEVPLYKCEICAYQTKHKRYLPEHILIHKSASGVPLHKCEVCAYQTKFRSHLQRHLLIHKSASEVPLYKCEICAYQSKFKGSLRRHMVTHKSALEVPLYKCEICAYQSKFKGSLRRHMLIHKSVSELSLNKSKVSPSQTEHTF